MFRPLAAFLLFTVLACEEETIAPDLPPPNQPPVVSGSIPDQRLTGPGDATTFDVSVHFSDPDGDALMHEAVSSDTAVATISMAGSAATLTGGSAGGAGEVTVTARDPDGAEASTSFGVVVNRPPAAPVEISAQTLWHGATRVDMDLIGHFIDPDGDVLTYTVASSDTVIVPVALHPGPVVSLAGPVQGEATITVTAHDPDGLEVQATFPVEVVENPDRVALVAFYNATDGPNWPRSDNWLTDMSLEDWHAVDLNEMGSVSCLGGPCRWPDGDWETLRVRSIEHLPSELGDLEALERLAIAGSFGELSSGPIPPELGNLEALKVLAVRGLRLSGHIPPELANLKALEQLVLWGNHLSGPVPEGLRDLPLLEYVRLTHVVNHPPGSPEWRRDNSDLCASPPMRSWLEEKWGENYVKPGGGIRPCDEGGLAGAYLMQAVQSRESPVPLVAGEDALLRVFTLSPPFQARFYLDGHKTHEVEVARTAFAVAGDGAHGAGARRHLDLAYATPIPGGVIRPGLEMVIENEHGRIPAEGSQAVDVRELPPFNLTLVPLLKKYGDDPRLDSIFAGDTAFIARADSMAADPERGNWRLWHTADLLPVGAMRVTAHAPVEYDPRKQGGSRTPGASGLLAVQIVRTLEGSGGYWMGLGSMFGGGVAILGGWVSMTGGSSPATVAHELGHNLGLLHTPTSSFASFVDANYPYPDGDIGVWGFAHRELPRGRIPPEPILAHRLVSPTTDDIMRWIQLHPDAWISDYHFNNALENRLQKEGGAATRMAAFRAPVRSLLLWGGTGAGTGAAYLEPAFVVDAPPSLPEQSGPWTLEGRDAGGAVLFSLSFAMPEIADAGEGAGSFAYTLPVRSGWEALASVTLSGPGGLAILDGSTDRPVSIYRDGDGKVRAILHGDPVQADGGPGRLVGGPTLDVVTSWGIPPIAAWLR